MESPGPKIIQPKMIQEQLLGKGGEVPEKYIHKVGFGGLPNPSSVESKDIPVIDVGLLTPSSMTSDQLDKLRSALTDWGCFQVINHGMISEFLDKIREITKEFFSLGVEEKKKYLRQVNDFEGYGDDIVLSEQQTVLDWTDRLYLSVYPQHSRNLKLWPQNPTSFSETVDEYSMKLQEVTNTVLKAMARSLNLEENCFVDLYGEERGKMDLRLNFYPSCSRPELVLGQKPHADSSIITLVLQDKEVEGLQFLKDDRWYKAPIIPDALLVIIGDQTEILTNGIYKSPMHKVVTNSEKERFSLAAFYMPESDQEIEPFESLVKASKQPRLYKKMTNYGEIYFEYYQRGLRAIEAAKI